MHQQRRALVAVLAGMLGLALVSPATAHASPTETAAASVYLHVGVVVGDLRGYITNPGDAWTTCSITFASPAGTETVAEGIDIGPGIDPSRPNNDASSYYFDRPVAGLGDYTFSASCSQDLTASRTITVADPARWVKVSGSVSGISYNGRLTYLGKTLGICGVRWDVPWDDADVISATAFEIKPGRSRNFTWELGNEFEDFGVWAVKVYCHPDELIQTTYAEKVVPFRYLGQLSKATVAVASQEWTGAQIMPAPTVSLGGKVLDAGTEYTVTYNANRSIGKGYVTVRAVTGTVLAGSKKVSFKIVPTATTITQTVAGVRYVRAYWAKVPSAEKVSKYQVQYALSGTTSWHTKTVSSRSSSLKITGLKAGQAYDLRVRSYKTVHGKRYYSAWSPVATSGPVE